MERRDLLRAFASAAALTLLPHETLSAWSSVATGLRPPNGLSDAQMLLVRAVADTIIPRTDTPSATDVGVHQFVEVIVAEQLTEAERSAAEAGLAAIDDLAMSTGGVVFADLTPEQRASVMQALEAGDRGVEPAKTYWRLKGLVVHGYFTSEPVMKQVMNHQVMPGTFQGAAPMPIRTRTPPSPLPPPASARSEGPFHG